MSPQIEAKNNATAVRTTVQSCPWEADDVADVLPTDGTGLTLLDSDALTVIECKDSFERGRVVGPEPMGNAKYSGLKHCTLHFFLSWSYNSHHWLKGI